MLFSGCELAQKFIPGRKAKLPGPGHPADRVEEAESVLQAEHQNLQLSTEAPSAG